MGFRWQWCWSFVVMVVVREVVATPLPSPSNNYQVLTNHQVWKVSGQGAMKVLAGLEEKGVVDILSHTSTTPRIRISLDSLAKASTALSQAEIPYQVLVHDLANHIKERQRATREVLRGPKNLCLERSCPAPLDGDYMTFEQMEWYLKELAATYPSVSLQSIGKSIEGRDIWRVHIEPAAPNKVRDAPIEDGDAKQNAIWFEGGIHAREWISPAVTLHLIHYFATNKKLTQNLHVYAAPMVNPDGYEYSRTTDRLWRKNRRPSMNAECMGVDLNRNWNKDYGVGASDHPCSQVYKGTEPFSEPETQALRDDMESVSNRHNLRLVLALHSFGNKVMYPWGGTLDPAPDTPMMKHVGKLFAEDTRKFGGTKYTVDSSSAGLYLASGATDDWAKAVLKTPLVYTLELADDGQYGFVLPPNMIESNCREVWKGLEKMLSFINERWNT